MRKSSIVLVSCSLLLLSLQISAATKESIRIILQSDSKGFRVLQHKHFAGEMNRRKTPVEERTDHFVFQLYSKSGEVLFEDSFRDPRIVHYDVPADDGTLTGGQVMLESAAISVVVPDHPKAERLDIFDIRRGIKRDANRVIAPTDLVLTLRIEDLKNAKR